MKNKLQALQKIDNEAKILEGTAALLSWDQETYMPVKSIQNRSKQTALIQKIIHEKCTDQKVGSLLKDLGATEKSISTENSFTEIENAFLSNFNRKYQRDIKLSPQFVSDFAETVSVSQSAWVEARSKNDFKMFAPHLQKVLDFTKKKAESIGYEEHPYDALLDEYEPWTTTAKIKGVFEQLKGQLTELSNQIAHAQPIDDSFLNESFGTNKQKEFSLLLLKDLGFNLDIGRLDASAHPFTIAVGGDDVRVTTRYNEYLIKTSIFGTIHECGHGLYEMGFGEKIKNSLLANGASFGIHESQSRTWENAIGRNVAFWKFYYPKLQKLFPERLSTISQNIFYKAINKCEPSLIRVEADEVTYGLHIILRFELELQLLSGDLKVDELPEAWNCKMKELLGIVPDSDANGVLQDVHWSIGIFGYFPTYALGNLYGAQFYDSMLKNNPDFESQIASGDFKTVLNWYRENIHQYGAIYSADDLCKRVTGKSLNSDYFMSYLTNKYTGIYNLI